jgi:hypothetical protein
MVFGIVRYVRLIERNKGKEQENGKQKQKYAEQGVCGRAFAKGNETAPPYPTLPLALGRCRLFGFGSLCLLSAFGLFHLFSYYLRSNPVCHRLFDYKIFNFSFIGRCPTLFIFHS